MSPTPKQNPKLPRGISMYEGHYRVRVSYQGKQYSCGMYPSLKLAKLALDKYRAQVILDTFVPPVELRRQLKAKREAEKAQRVTVGEWSTIWLEGLREGPRPRSEGTITSYSSTLNAHVLPLLRDRPLNKVTNDDVAECVKLAKKRGEGASRNTGLTMRAMFNAAVLVGAGGLEKSPVTMKFEKSSSRARTDDEIPSLDEAEAIAAAMPADTRLAVELGMWQGLRVGEVLGLQRQDFKNLDKPGRAQVTVTRQWSSKSKPPAYAAPKADSFGTSAVPDVLAGKIQAHLDNYVDNAPESPVFPSAKDKTRPMSHNAFARRWNNARAQVRPGTAFHSLRHLSSSLYEEAGATITDGARRYRHKSLDNEQRYRHGNAARDRELAAKLNDMMKEN